MLPDDPIAREALLQHAEALLDAFADLFVARVREANRADARSVTHALIDLATLRNTLDLLDDNDAAVTKARELLARVSAQLALLKGA